MRYIFSDLRAHLQLFTLEEQLSEIDYMINDIIENINPNHIITSRYNKIQQLKKLKEYISLKL